MIDRLEPSSMEAETLMALRILARRQQWRRRPLLSVALLMALVMLTAASASVVETRESTPTSTSINQSPHSKATTQPAIDSEDHRVFHNEFRPAEPSAEPLPIATMAGGHRLSTFPSDPTSSETKPPTPTVSTKPTSQPAPPREHQSNRITRVPTTSVAVHQTESEAMLAFHKVAHTRLTAERNTITKQLMLAHAELEQIENQLKNERQFYADAHAENVVQAALPSPRGGKVRELSCHGWKKTNRCQYAGSRRPEMDKSCFTPVSGGAAGYCEVRDDSTGEAFKAMRVNCSSIPVKTTIWCQLAPQFANFPARIERAIAAVPSTAPPSKPANTIVMVVLSSQLQDAKASIHALRTLKCALPIELWYFESEMKPHMDELRTLVQTAQDIVWRPLHTLPYSTPAVKFAKIHAIAHSAFANVLYLDAAVLPLRDPTYLFSLPEFLSTGAIFWPDLFHPATTESNIQPSSLLWELLDMPAVRMFEQDDRQLLIRRDSDLVRASLRVLEMFSVQRPNLFEKLQLMKQAKDSFRLAWIKTRTPFEMVAVPPAIGGSLMTEGKPSDARERFCGTHVAQHDPSGRMLFVHRHSAGGEPNDLASGDAMTHVQAFNWQRDGKRLSGGDMMYHYDVQAFKIASEGDRPSSVVSCFGHTSKSTRHQTEPWIELPQ